MSYTHFHPEILPSPFLAVDQIINTLVYGSFYDIPERKLQSFLIPKTEIGTSQSYLLGALYSYLLRETHYKKALYVWQDDGTTPLSSSDLGLEYVLGKKIDYDSDILKNKRAFEFERKENFAHDNVIWAQHLYYQSIVSMKVLPLCLPRDRLENPSHMLMFKKLIEDIGRQQDTACIFIDDFEIQFDEHDGVKILSEHSSLSDCYSQYARETSQNVSVLLDQPSYNAVESDCSRAVLGLS